MNKKRTNITLDPDVYEKAKDLGINISQTSQRALRIHIEHHQNEGQPAHPYTSSDSQSTAIHTTDPQHQQEDPDEFLTEFE